MYTQQFYNSGFILKKNIIQDVYTRVFTDLLSRRAKSWKKNLNVQNHGTTKNADADVMYNVYTHIYRCIST